MKIRKLNIKNIHSLKGEHTIDFAEGVLGNAGLFAITGPTGSGKSSILDAITLALYNRIPRIDKAISETIIDEEGVIITKNAPDCYAEVEYEVKGKIYRSSWSIKRTRTNTLSSRKQELIEGISGEILASGKAEVVKENERIIGLNYEQFVQSLILAQGQFAKLLLAKKDERNKLLEEITGSSVYRKIGAAVYGRFKKATDAVDDQKLRIGEIVLIDEEQLKLIKEDIDVKTPQSKIIAGQIKELEEKRKVKESIVLNSKKKQENEEDLKKFEFDKKEFSDKKACLEDHDKLVMFKDQLMALERNEEKSVDLTKKIDRITKVDLPELEQEKKKLITAGSELINDGLTEDNYELVLEEFRSRIIALVEAEKETLRDTKQEAQRIQDKIKDLKAYKIEFIESADITAQIEAHLKLINELCKKSGVHELDKLRIRKDEIVNSLLPANQLLGNRKLFDEKSKGISELKAKITNVNEHIEECNKVIKQNSSELDALVEPLKMAKTELEEWQKRKSLDQHRNELQKDQPCPLCGSLEHPYASNAEDVLISKLQEKYDDLLGKSEKFKEQILKLQTKSEAFTTSNAKDNEELTKRLKANLELETVVIEACNKLNWKIDSPVAEWEQAINQLQGHQSELDDLEKKLAAKAILGDIQLLYLNYKKLKSKFEEAEKKRVEAYQGNDINLEVSKLKQEIAQNCLRVENSTQRLKEFTREHSEIKVGISKIREVLLTELKKLGVDTIAILKSKILDEGDAGQIRKELQALKETEVKLNANKEIIDKELKSAKDLDDSSISLEQVTLNLTDLTKSVELLKKEIWEQENKIKIDAENKEKHKKYGDELAALQKELNIWTKMNILIGDATGKKFSNFVQDLTLKKLIEFGNARLRGFSDRYLLDIENEADTLKVIDTYMGNSKRSVTSLSGGETFMLSLALAFGLSDLAARNVEIESLFIDEGFGSLDPDSLNQAITILENMQNESNKSIGIISHVSELKDRIGTKVKLIITSAGYSTIEIE